MAQDRDSGNPNRRGALLGLIVVVIIFIIGWLLAHQLYKGGRLEDCLLSGRTNCAPITAPTR